MCVCVCVCVCVHTANTVLCGTSSSTHMCLLDNTPYSIELTVSSSLAGVCSCSMLHNIFF